jgi:hypothetical protein
VKSAALGISPSGGSAVLLRNRSPETKHCERVSPLSESKESRQILADFVKKPTLWLRAVDNSVPQRVVTAKHETEVLKVFIVQTLCVTVTGKTRDE